jgi:hypothetical protein
MRSVWILTASMLLAACGSASPGLDDGSDATPDTLSFPDPDSGSDSVSGSDSGSAADSDSDSASDALAKDGAPDVEPDTFDAAPIVTETCEQPPSTGVPGPAKSLKDAGLYRDFATKTLKSCWVEFTPKYTLWSDGLVKHRFIWLPKGTKVDVSKMDRWTFPVGTRVFKEFATGSGQLVETRLIERTATGYTMGSYVWNPAGTDATYTEGGASTSVVLNPGAPAPEQKRHDVPSNVDCHRCHDGETGKLLGFSAIQLSKPMPGLNFKGLAARGFDPIAWKNAPPATDTGIDYPIPGTAAQVTAFGALHANCGHCHNALGEAGGFVTMRLRVAIKEELGGSYSVSTDNVTSTTIGVDMQYPSVTPGYTKRVVLGSLGVGQSGMYYRDSHRGDAAQMPPLGTKLMNPTLLAAVKGWIEE